MDRDRAEALASLIGDESRLGARVIDDGDYFAVEVVRSVDGKRDTWTLYDESDWDGWRDRITT